MTIFNDDTRRIFQRRIESLRPDAQRRWGKMSVHQMVCHLADTLRITLGDIRAKSIPSPMHFKPIKHLIIDVLPWPKGRIQGPPEAFLTSPDEWTRDIRALQELLERLGACRNQQAWPDHPTLGRMSGPLWARLTCRHFDHHLTQFGA